MDVVSHLLGVLSVYLTYITRADYGYAINFSLKEGCETYRLIAPVLLERFVPIDRYDAASYVCKLDASDHDFILEDPFYYVFVHHLIFSHLVHFKMDDIAIYLQNHLEVM